MEYEFPENDISTKARKIKYKINTENCWECSSHTKDPSGYPVITRNNIFWRMSRYVYTITNGEIPEGYFILHSCDNPKCINPEHLSAGTAKENSKDMVSKGRQAYGSKNGGGRKLDEEKVRAIRNDSRSLLKIAKDYGVSKKLILIIKQRKIWRHVI